MQCYRILLYFLLESISERFPWRIKFFLLFLNSLSIEIYASLNRLKASVDLETGECDLWASRTFLGLGLWDVILLKYLSCIFWILCCWSSWIFSNRNLNPSSKECLIEGNLGLSISEWCSVWEWWQIRVWDLASVRNLGGFRISLGLSSFWEWWPMRCCSMITSIGTFSFVIVGLDVCRTFYLSRLTVRYAILRMRGSLL